jgi:hypothetical protein
MIPHKEPNQSYFRHMDCKSQSFFPHRVKSSEKQEKKNEKSRGLNCFAAVKQTMKIACDGYYTQEDD